jgi:hypothetical protein
MSSTKLKLHERANAKFERRRTELISIIKDGYKSVKSKIDEVGNALIEFRDGEYWKYTHTSFKEFCDEIFDISDRYARYIMDGVEVKASLPPKLRPLIINENQTRTLLKMPPDHRIPVVESCLKTGFLEGPDLAERHRHMFPDEGSQNGTIVPPSVSVKSGSKSLPNPVIKKNGKVEPTCDCAGNIIPLESLSTWDKGKEFGLWFEPVRTAFEKAETHIKGSHQMFWKVPISAVEQLKQIYAVLRTTYPYAVCPKCHGEPSLKNNGCSFCNSTGMICKEEWEKLNPNGVHP